jgi:hypothetical protein
MRWSVQLLCIGEILMHVKAWPCRPLWCAIRAHPQVCGHIFDESAFCRSLFYQVCHNANVPDARPGLQLSWDPSSQILRRSKVGGRDCIRVPRVTRVWLMLGAEWRLNIVRTWRRPSGRVAYIHIRRSSSRVVYNPALRCMRTRNIIWLVRLVE